MRSGRLTKLAFAMAATAATLGWAGVAVAHELGEEAADRSVTPHDLWRTWEFDPGVVIPLALSAWLYTQGIWKLWRSSGQGRGIKRWEVACFAGGWLSLVVALVSPLHPWGEVLFSAHMVQHEILMLVSAPLLVLGRPLIAFLWALPEGWAKALVRATSARWWVATWRFFSSAFVAWVVHAIALWSWHIPYLFDATLDHEWVHALQHASFLGTALLFWWALMQGRGHAMNYGMGILYMFTTALHSGLLGALITFAGTSWYPGYAHTTQLWGLSPMEDQQLGGLIMWIPAGIVYIVAGVLMMVGWMRESEARVLRRESGILSVTAAASPPEVV